MVGGKLLHLLSCICYPASSQAVDSIEQVRNSHLSAADPSSQMVDGIEQVRCKVVRCCIQSGGRCQVVGGIEVSGIEVSDGRWYRGVRNSHLSAADPSSQVVGVRYRGVGW